MDGEGATDFDRIRRAGADRPSARIVIDGPVPAAGPEVLAAFGVPG